jgi:succinate-semialdehyde dehydrogenase / glutarate-semialdehyde dehydrogenase
MTVTELERHRVYLNGEWVATGNELAIVNPADGLAFAHVAVVDREQVRNALSAAHAAFPAWRALTAKERSAYLVRVADELKRRHEEIARTITLENGKPLAQSKGEVMMAEDHLRWFAEEGKRAYGRAIPQQDPRKRNLVVKSPIGPVGAIAPWNFPLVLAVRKVAPALAAGCSVVLKPASKTPLCAVLLAECMQTAGIPAGVFQLVIGSASMIAAEFLENPLCRKITFTGSTEVGQSLIRDAARYVKPLSLELGGHAPVLVFEDCDLNVAVRETMVSKFRNNGQSCIAANRIYVQKSIHEEFLARFVAATKALKVGAGLEPGIDIGPLIDERALASALNQVDDAVRHGAKVCCGGTKLEIGGGNYLAPTVLDAVSEESLCMCEETFAPLAPVCTFDTEEEAIARANNSPYGLSAYIMTRDYARITRCAEALEAGSIGVNDGAPTTSNAPFGGIKQSGWGRELGSEGLDAFLETKHVSIGMY